MVVTPATAKVGLKTMDRPLLFYGSECFGLGVDRISGDVKKNANPMELCIRAVERLTGKMDAAN